MKDRLHAAALRVFGRLPRRVRRMIVRRVAPSFTVGALCRVERADGHVLLIRQSYRTRWGLPGGLLEKGEEASTAAVRELKEEVGLDVVLVGPPAVVVDAPPRRVDIVFNGRPANAN